MRLYGKNPIIERLRSKPASIKKIYLQEGFNDAGYIYKKAKQSGIPVILSHKSKLLKLARNTNTQGILADVDDFIYVPYDELLETASQKKRTLVFLDSLNDPQNLGAILRSLACLGHFSVVLPSHESVEITETVLRVASGGENHVPVAKVPNLVNAIKSAKEAGFSIAGTVVSGGQPLEETKLPFPLGLVIGSEQKGIRDVIRKHLDLELSITMYLDRLSFNVAQAATIFCYEIKKQTINYKNQKNG